MPNATEWAICPECKGNGTVGPGFVYTTEAIGEQFASYDDFDQHMADIRDGLYDQSCGRCNGKRVVTKEQADWLTSEEYYDMRAMERAERAFGC